MDIEIEDPATDEEKDEPVSPENGTDKGEEETSTETDGDEMTGQEESETPESEPESAPEDEVEKWRDLALRNQADLQNYRKRMAREKSEAVKFANVSLLRNLLPILDNFEMGLQAARAESEDSIIFQGMAMVRKQIDEFLSEEGVEVIESEGVDFDPNQHEAIKQEWSDDVAEGAIIGELRRGFRMGERLLRPANVVVSKGPQPDSEDPSEGEG